MWLQQKHLLIRAVFKHSLTYREVFFRTPHIEPSLRLNLATAKRKRAPRCRRAPAFSGKIPISTGTENSLNTLLSSFTSIKYYE
jgi:hypothetical protein